MFLKKKIIKLLLEKSKLLITIRTMSLMSTLKLVETLEIKSRLKKKTYCLTNLEIRHSVKWIRNMHVDNP